MSKENPEATWQWTKPELTRDQEIEALAEKLYTSWNATDESWCDEKDAFKCAESFLNYRDEWRKAREQ